MKKSLLFLVVFFLFCGIIPQFSLAQPPDAEVIIHERVINKLLKTVGEIKGTESFEWLLFKGTYSWTLNQGEIHLLTDSAFFIGSLQVETGWNSYEHQVDGALIIRYNAQTDKIGIKLKKAEFPVILKVLGKSFTIKTIQLTDYLNEEWLFDGPGGSLSAFQVKMPDNSTRNIESIGRNAKIFLEPGKLRVQSEIVFKEVLKKP